MEPETEGVAVQEAAVPQWQTDLEQVGLVRRLLRARKWYGGDWWFVVIGATLLFAIILLALFPGWFAPFDPHEEVGPRLLAPGEVPDEEVVIGRAGEGIKDVADFVGEGVKIAVVQGEPSSQVMRDRARELAEELKAQGQEVVLRARPARYPTAEEALDAVVTGEALAAVISSRT